MKKSLKNKVLISVPLIFIAVMLIVIVVVSVILSKQNRKVADTLIQNTFNIIRYTIAERQEKLLFDSRQMATLNDMGGKIKYVTEIGPHFKYDAMKPTYVEIATEIYNIGSAANVWKASVYNINGELIAFAIIGEDKGTLGCVHNRETIRIASLKPQEELTDELWTGQDSLPAGIGYNFGKAMPNRQIVRFEIVDGSLCLVAYVPVMGKEYSSATEKMEEKQVGIMVTAQKFSPAFVKKISELTGTEVNIFTSGGMVCSGISSDTYADYKTFDLRGFADVKGGWSLTEQPVILSDVDIAGGSYFQGVLPIYSDSKCVAAIVCLYSKELARVNTMQVIKLLSLVYFVGIVLIVPITILMVVRGVINPIRKIASMMRETAYKKDFTRMLDVKTQDEIGDLALSFNEMADNLRKTTTSIDNLNREIAERKRTEDALRKSEEFTKRIIESSDECIKVLDLEGRLLSMSVGGQKLLEVDDVTPFLNTSFIDFWKGEEREGCLAAISKAKQGDTGIFYGYFPTAKGAPKWWEIIVSPIKDPDGSISSLLAVSRDITERKKAEETMKRLNKDLRDTVAKVGRVNDELKDFVYIASHDLREPLRKISAFGEILSASLKDKLNNDDKENLGYMIDGGKRMQQMIDALLTYSRITTGGVNFEAVDLNKVVKELCEVELAVKIEETSAKITVPEQLHTVNGDPAQVRQLIQNLIANALKFQKKCAIPQITIRSSAVDNDMVRVEVADNGIGIKQEQFKDIFIMFRRLHSRQEYEGSGIGLAVCKKIVERHGGDMGVSSTYGEGSTFWFTLPAQKPSEKKQVEFTSTIASV